MREPQEIIEDTRRKIRELRAEVDYEWAYGRRKEYFVNGPMLDAVHNALWYMARYEIATQKASISMSLIREYQDSEIKKIIKYVNELYHTKPGKQHRKDEITPDMIERARSYPFNELLPVNKNMAFCPFHNNTRTPAFNTKNNYGFCHSCGWKGDPIKFVMDKEGITFPEAVRRLC